MAKERDKRDEKNTGPRISLCMVEQEQEGTSSEANGGEASEHVRVRRRLGVRLLQAKIQERVLRRISHVLRMENAGPTKRVTLGWYAPLVTQTPEKKPRLGTLEYKRKILIEAVLGADSIEYLVWDR